MRLSFIVRTLLLSTLLAAGIPRSAQAQTDYFFQPTGEANWNLDPNWLEPNLQNMFVPSSGFNERAVINSGGTAFVNTGGVPTPGAVTLGSTASGVGTLEVRSGGTLNVVAGTVTNGGIAIGPAGQGNVRVLPGGTLTSTGSLTMGGDGADTLTVGGTGAGTATLSVPSANLSGITRVFPNAAFSTTGNANFVGSSTYTVEVTSTGSGRINVGNNAQLNGSLQLNFAGVTPTLGNNWTLLEANQFNGTFDSVGFAAPSLPFNQNFVLTNVDVGGGRRQLRATVENVLVLEVDRDDGTARIRNHGGAAISLDSYFIGSDLGSLTPGTWNSFQDLGILGGGWLETRTGNDNLAEVRPTGAGSAPAGFNQPIGTIYNPFAGSFGQVGEDLEFVYSRPSDGAVINGVVTYTGTRTNTLALLVDPTGVEDTILRNTSQTPVQIDGYHVLSAAGSLTTTGWNSLDEQNFDGAGVWLEVGSNANQIGEFNSAGFKLLNPGDSLNLGKPYNGGTRDLVFEFLLRGEETSTNGVVAYEAAAIACISGDFNCNGAVENADLTLLLNNWGNAVPPTPPGWIGNPLTAPAVDNDELTALLNNWGIVAGAGGASLSLGSTAVPEPASWLLMALAGVVAVGRRKQR